MQGVITNCFRAVLRDGPNLNAKPITVLTCLTEINVDLSKSDESFYYVIASSGYEGFCLKRYVALKDRG